MKTVLVVPAASCRPCAYNQVDKSSLWCTNSTQAGSYLGLGVSLHTKMEAAA